MQTQTERIGVAKLDQYFSEKGWLFREQMVHDFGIDAHVEITSDNYPTGELIAIQIKSGMSFFTEEKDDSYIFRIEDKHKHYWASHSLPVILVLYHPQEDNLYWQVVSEATVASTGKGWKIEVPKNQFLNERSYRVLEKLLQPAPYIQKLNKLRLDRFWMEKIQDNDDVYVEFEDWVNKSLSRYQITLICEDQTQRWPMTYCPGMSVDQALEFFLPWADFEMDVDAHRDGSMSQWDAECYIMYDKEEGEAIYRKSFDDWYCEPDKILPYDDNGEWASYRLRLELNALGKSFLEIDTFLSETDGFHGRTFTIDELDR